MLRIDDDSDALHPTSRGGPGWNASRELLPFEAAIGTSLAPVRKCGALWVLRMRPAFAPMPGMGGYDPPPMAAIHIIDIEAAINHWRQRSPSPDGIALAPETQALGEVYARMVFQRTEELDEADLPPTALAAWLAWYDTTPDTPCIAICSTSQGDDLCKGCGRTFGEVQHWPGLSPVEKRVVWRRITLEHSAWRFNRYAERAAEGATAPAAT